MWELVFNHNKVEIHINYGSRENALPQYRLTVNGRKKVFKGETAAHDVERAIRDADWEVWVEMRSFNIKLD